MYPCMLPPNLLFYATSKSMAKPARFSQSNDTCASRQESSDQANPHLHSTDSRRHPVMYSAGATKGSNHEAATCVLPHREGGRTEYLLSGNRTGRRACDPAPPWPSIFVAHV